MPKEQIRERPATASALLKHYQWLSAIGAVTYQHRRTPQPAPGRRAEHSQHFSQTPAINLKTAKALGLEVPPTLLARADVVIE